MIAKLGGRQLLTCKECNDTEVVVSNDIAAVTCAYCVQKMIAPPDNYVKKSEADKKPRGWHLKIYYEKNGVVYSKGEIVTDPVEIKSLKKQSKLLATPKPKVKNKVSRGRKNARATK